MSRSQIHPTTLCFVAGSSPRMRSLLWHHALHMLSLVVAISVGPGLVECKTIKNGKLKKGHHPSPRLRHQSPARTPFNDVLIGADPPLAPSPPPGFGAPPLPPYNLSIPEGPPLRGMPGLQSTEQAMATFSDDKMPQSPITLPSCSFDPIYQVCHSTHAYLLTSGTHADDIPFGGR